jgi:hypothetical protein
MQNMTNRSKNTKKMIRIQKDAKDRKEINQKDTKNTKKMIRIQKMQKIETK